MVPESTPTSSPTPPSPRAPSAGPSPLWTAITLAILAAAVGWTLWRLGGSGATLVRYVHDPELRSGSSCRVTAVARGDHSQRARKALEAAEAALRDVESRMNAQDGDSEIAKFNAAPSGVALAISPMTAQTLRDARQLHHASRGAFDVTLMPLMQLWRQAFKDSRLPAEQEIQAARASSTWDMIDLADGNVVKKSGTVRVDLAGMARGYAVDRAAAAMAATAIPGGMINLAGNIRCFGTSDDGPDWQIPIRDPFSPDANLAIACLKIADRAVSVSSNYRTSVIEGRSYGTLLDPNTGWPAGAAPSATVVAATSMEAQAWSIALAILGPAGLECLPKDGGVEAMVITGTPGAWKVAQSPGFDKLLSVKPTLAATAAGSSPKPKAGTATKSGPASTAKPSPTPTAATKPAALSASKPPAPTSRPAPVKKK